MAFNLDNKWVWDFWFAQDGDQYHVFYLQADKSLGDPELRHWNVSVGHAVSTDLIHWTTLQDALKPSPRTATASEEAADSYTTWTGCVHREGDTWYMFYTGTKYSEKGLIQRVCLATSKDLLHWEKHPNNPLVELDPNFYDGLNLEYWHDASWRDPWIVKDPTQNLYHMYLTARCNQGSPDGRGAVGYASSTDLIHWKVGQPVLAPGWYGEMEVPQIEYIHGRYYLFCSVSTKFHSAAHRQSMQGTPLTGTKYFVADDLNGPYEVVGDGFIGADQQGSLYSGRVIQGPDQHWYLLAFNRDDAEGNFIGGICDPKRIEFMDDGQLELAKD
ncbi:hypothetical protein [Microbulbifer sp. JTAC008]|uniref:hypothetical protein n=1 Tax=unclassified Microbulbifer TaxID=2619833 RepID=UPI004039CAC5